MKTLLQNSKSVGLLLFFSLCMVSFGWSQGHETFDNLELSGSSYQSGSFTGEDGINWSYTNARGDIQVNGKAITLRNTNDAQLISETISGGIGTLQFSYMQAFANNVNLQVLINDDVVATVTTSGEANVVKTTDPIEVNINEDFYIEFKRTGNGAQVAIDDIIWSAYGGSVPPSITNVTQTPAANNVTTSDIVAVSADVNSAEGISLVELHWGLSSGSLSNTVSMSLDGENTYVGSIPAQLDGTTVYYEVYAEDVNDDSTTSAEYNYTVSDPVPFTIPYANDLRTQADYDEAVGYGFQFNNSNINNPGNNGYVQIINGSIVSPAIDFSAYDAIETSFDLGSFGGLTGQQLTVSVSNDGGATYTDLDTFSVTTSGNNYATFSQIIDLTSYNSTDGRIKYEMTGGTNSIRFRGLVIEEGEVPTSTPPVIVSVTQTPNAINVTSSDDVSVSAEITATAEISVVELHWGTETGNLTNTIAMGLEEGNTYTTISDIPAQPNNSTVYYEVYVMDANTDYATSSEYSYTVTDPVPFAIPYYNALRTQANYDEAEADGFVFTDAPITSPGTNGYVRIINGSVVTPLIDFSQHDALFTYFDLTTYGGVSNQQLTVFVSNDGGDTYTELDTFDIPTAGTVYETYVQYIDLSSFNATNGRIKYEMTGGGNSIRFRELTIQEFEGYVYDGAWSPSNPVGNATDTDDVVIASGATSFASDIELKNLYVAPGASLSVEGILNVKGNHIINRGELVFVSTENGDGELAAVSGLTMYGDATVQRYISENRAFRMLASSVTTTTSINENWQEGVNNPDPETNINPNEGFGTHITGSATGDNGFDATTTGNPSMFTVNLEEQEFEPIDNTNVLTLNAGTPYLLFVRGDRSIDLGDNQAAGETILRATGKLRFGNTTQTFADLGAGEFAMFGNPYQSAVDINALFDDASTENVNTGYYYVYDATLGNHGGYATVELPSGTNDQGSDASQYLQPGQGAQFATSAAGTAKLTFKEAHKAPGNFASTNRPEATNKIVVQLLTTENYNNNGPVHDGVRVSFDAQYNNEITQEDALKPRNFYENLGINNGGTLLSIEKREMPQVDEVYQLDISGYTYNAYTLKLVMDGLEDYLIYLDDHYTGNSTLFEEGVVAYAFEVDNNDPLSSANDRFSIRVAERFLNVSDHVLAGASLYPNPVYGDSFNIQVPNLSGKEVTVVITDLLGRNIQTTQETLSGNALEVDFAQKLDNGIYLVSISAQGEKHTFKLIKR